MPLGLAVGVHLVGNATRAERKADDMDVESDDLMRLAAGGEAHWRFGSRANWKRVRW